MDLSSPGYGMNLVHGLTLTSAKLLYANNNSHYAFKHDCYKENIQTDLTLSLIIDNNWKPYRV